MEPNIPVKAMGTQKQPQRRTTWKTPKNFSSSQEIQGVILV